MAITTSLKAACASCMAITGSSLGLLGLVTSLEVVFDEFAAEVKSITSR